VFAIGRGGRLWSATDPMEGAPTMGTTEKLSNKMDELKGQAKQQAGKATDNEQWQAEGKMDETKGDLKQAGEKVKDVFR
jgi:uncharacterized protein YjbJ (UPF0337 family)